MRRLSMLLPILFPVLSHATTLDALPVWTPPEVSAQKDWLVHDITESAGAYRSADGRELVLDNGLIRRTFRLAPNAATVGYDNLMTGESVIRAVRPEARVSLNGVAYDVGGLTGQPNHAYLKREWIDAMESPEGSLAFTGFEIGQPAERMTWTRVRHAAPNVAWPPKGVALRLDFAMPEGSDAAIKDVTVSVHYELYDDVPVLSKWITVRNGGATPVRLDSFTSEVLAAVEYGSDVDNRGVAFIPPALHVETDYAFGGMGARDSSRHTVHWVPDPDYATQVNYERLTPCLLEVRPSLGPAVDIAPGGTFESFRAFELIPDSTDRERNGLAQRRMYRTIAPWVTENPLMLHIRQSDRRTVETALDQCAEVGFEMAILSFGSGFNIENTSKANRDRMKEFAAYAKGKGVEFGGYSLLASRSIDEANDVVMAADESPTFGHSPCLGSAWGKDYFENLYRFYESSGFLLLEHDGSYPGDICRSTEHPGHRGYED
ncbi:MAG: hypothetical protein RLZZ303_2537, partial [Candidatus Hydrogenedentota bacterium]